MVSLLVATTADPASIGPASALLALSPANWAAGPSLLPESVSFVSGRIRLLQLNGRLVTEDHLDRRWEAGTGEQVEEIIFLSRHVAASNRPALTLHPIGVPHLQPHETSPAGGRPGWAAPPCPRIGPWLRLLKNVATKQNLVPEFEITLEATHHGPEVNSPAMFFEIGSTEEYWGRNDAAHAVAMVLQEGLGLEGGPGVGQWSREVNVSLHVDNASDQARVLRDNCLPNLTKIIVKSANKGEKVLVGLGGGHYAPRHMDVVQKESVWVGHLLSNYSLPMEEPSGPSKPNPKGSLDEIYSQVGGSWKEAITEAVTTTRSAFPDGDVIAHLDSKSLKSWQRNAITWFLAREHIPLGKSGDFIPAAKVLASGE